MPLVAILGFTIFCFVDCLQTPKARIKALPRVLWLILVLIPLIGGALWLTVGRTWGNHGSTGGGGQGYGGRGGPPRAPDDDDDFLRGLT